MRSLTRSLELFVRTLECFLRALAFGQIEMSTDNAADESIRLTTHGEATREHVDVVAVLVAKAEFDRVVALAAQHAVDDLAHGGSIVRVEQPLPGAHVRLDLVLAVTEHLPPVRGVHHRTGFEIPVPDAFLGARERQRQSLLALAQGELGSLPLRDVAHDDLDGLIGRILEQGADDLDIPDAAIEPEECLLDRRHGLAHDAVGGPVPGCGCDDRAERNEAATVRQPGRV